jgi:genome maintenance exonuclease 1
MKIFNHQNVDLGYSDLESITNPDGKRQYLTPSGKSYPSITTILSSKGNPAIEAWKKRVGEEEAERISRVAREIGNALHDNSEKYLKNEMTKEDFSNLSNMDKWMFKSFRNLLDRIDNVIALETALYSDNLKIAGRVDCIAEFDGVPAIIDFKNAKKPKKEEWIEDYFLQATFYSYAFYERTGRLIENIRILVCVRDGQIQVFEKNVKDYVKKLDNRVKEYYNKS